MGKPKTTSKVKLTNKSSSKKMKSKAKQIAMTKTKQLKNHNFSHSHGTSKKKDLKNEKLDYRRLSALHDDNELDTDDAEFSDDEMRDFVSKNMKNMSFLGSASRRKKGRDGIASFEKVPRASAFNENTEFSKTGTVELLPFKGDKGLIKRTGERDQIERAYSSDEETYEEKVEEAPQAEPMTVIEVIAAQQEELNKKKLEIAQHSLDIVENPQENIGKLKKLLLLCSKDEPSTIKKLSILSLFEIFKDIIPSYRIRELSEDERAIKVSKDVRVVRGYEDTLLRSYQKYLQILDENVKDCLKLLKMKKKSRNGAPRTLDKEIKIMANLSITSLKCLAGLLNTVTHFNFRNNIINVLVPSIGLSQDLAQGGEICFESIKSALKADPIGDVALDIIRVIHALTKSKQSLKPKVLEVLLFLQLDQHLINETEQKGNKIERLKEKKDMIKKMSKKERKRKKVEDKLNKELQEVEAVENRDKVGKKHTEILKFLFVIYFRVLKTGHKSALLPVVLKGLAKFSHLINIDFFGDLMNCLETLLQSGELDTEERLHCILTALKVLSGQGEVLTIDPRQFYSELYNVFLNVSPGTDESCFDSMKDCLHIMLIKRRKQVSSPQVFGFLKRISTMLLQLQGERLPDVFLLVRSIFQLYDKCDYLLDNENFGRGVFQPEITNPEHCNAESTALWEFPLLSKFYEANSEIYCKHILDGAPSSGNRALPVGMIQRQTPNDECSMEEDPTRCFQAIPSNPRIKKKRRNNMHSCAEFKNLLETSEKYSDIKMEHFLNGKINDVTKASE